MSARIARIAAALSVAALALWLWLDPTGGEAPGGAVPSSDPTWSHSNPSVASAVPCAVPLSWRVARVDPRFRLEEDDVRALVEEAGAAWEEAAGRSLFVHDPEGGFPVRLIWDERQERGAALRQGEARVDAVDDRLEARRRRHEESVRSFSDRQAELGARAEDLRERLGALNDSIRSWNESGGAPPPVRMRLQAAGDALEDERSRLEREERELREWARVLDEERATLERALEARERMVRELAEEFPRETVESGLYREAVREREGRAVAVDREIRVYRFDGPEELRLIAAHELGHALGLGHLGEPGGLMSVSYIRGEGSADGRVVRAPDVRLLRERCPELFRGRPLSP